jgi:hypothetical protein
MNIPPRRDRRKWACGFLRGQIGGFMKDDVTLAAVQGAARVAMVCGVTAEEISQLLARAQLTWSAATRQVACGSITHALNGHRQPAEVSSLSAAPSADTTTYLDGAGTVIAR